MSLSILRSPVPSRLVHRSSTQMSMVRGSGENMSHDCHNPRSSNGPTAIRSMTGFGGNRLAGIVQLKAANA